MRSHSVIAVVALVLAAVSPRACAQDAPSRPKIIEQRQGNVTNLSVEGQLAATHELPCVDVERIEKRDTPADLITGVRKCIEEDDYERASGIYLMVFVFARFDADRVADVSARDAGQALVIQLRGTLNEGQRARLQTAFLSQMQNPAKHATLCERTRSIGPPDYEPRYMILHGMDAMTRPETLVHPYVSGFDATQAWATVRTSYMKCT